MHTPASVFSQFNDKTETATWDRYIAALETLPPDIVALGITDYYTIEGYKRLLLEKSRGRLANISLLLPIIEMRLDRFAGNKNLQKINFHVVFSEELPPDLIEKWFLQRLLIERKLQGGRPPFRGTLSGREDLERLGDAIIEATPVKARGGQSALDVGFANATVDTETIWSLLNQSVFQNMYLTAIGVGEWSQMRWDGGGAADKRDAIESVDFVLTAASTQAAYDDRYQILREADVNARLFDASDAHYYAESSQPNRLGETMTWVKACPTFSGLRRAIRCFERRVRVGGRPDKLQRLDLNKTRYIESIKIGKSPDAALDEIWFDVELPINADLVAIIGNQGGGKSALTDSLAHAANVPSHDFSFLTKEKFCDRTGKAAAFEVRLTWADGSISERRLSDIGSVRGLARVQYVPQGFFDRVTNETSVLEDGQFYCEIKKVVFSHVPESERLGCSTLDEWVAKRGAAIRLRLSAERAALAELNADIQALELSCTASALKTAQEELDALRKTLTVHEAARPQEVPGPGGATVGDRVEALRQEEALLADEQARLAKERGELVARRVAVENAQTDITTAVNSFRTALRRVSEALGRHAVSFDVASAVRVEVDTEALEASAASAATRIKELDVLVGTDEQAGLRGKLAAVRAERAAAEGTLESAGRAYQSYLDAIAEWQSRRTEILGDEINPASGSVRFAEQRLESLQVDVPSQLTELRNKRRDASTAILISLEELADVYREAARAVQDTITTEELTRSKYRIDFDVGLHCVGFANRFFEFVKYTGSFAGEDDARERLDNLLGQRDMNDPEGALAMVEDVVEHLHWNKCKDPPKPTDPSSFLRQHRTLAEVYDFLFGFGYLEPSFALSLNGKPLRQLSPGERGVLLLIFYLVIDRSDIPLIIDQPEGNLNNQSIFEHLVPVFSAAKERRQILIVTHNPNLAVVCDAEQIIHCSIDTGDGNRVVYRSGPLEDDQFNHLSLDVLDGTAAAFRARQLTYADGGGL